MAQLAADALELLVAVGVLRALADLPIALQAVAHLVQQGRHDGMADLVTLAVQLARQLANAFTGPPQRRFGVPSGHRIDQAVEVSLQLGIDYRRRFAPSSRSANSLGRQRLRRRQFRQSPHDRIAVDTGCP